MKHHKEQILEANICKEKSKLLLSHAELQRNRFLRTANTVGIANQYGLFRSSDKRFRSFPMYTATDGRTLTHTPGRDKLCCMISVVVTLILR